MNDKLLSSFASVTSFCKGLRASRSARRGGVCGGFPPLEFLVWVMCKLNYKVLCISLPWMQSPVKLSKIVGVFFDPWYFKFGMGGDGDGSMESKVVLFLLKAANFWVMLCTSVSLKDS